MKVLHNSIYVLFRESKSAYVSTRTGLTAAQARGRKGVRKAKLNNDQVKQIKALLKDPDIKVTDIAKQYGVCRATIFNAVGPVKPERA